MFLPGNWPSKQNKKRVKECEPTKETRANMEIINGFLFLAKKKKKTNQFLTVKGWLE